VRLGIEAPRDVTVHREEVYDAIKRENTPDTKQG
jgi:carbon storage regulator